MSGADDAWAAWIGRQETVSDLITAMPARALSATLDRAPDGAALGEPLPLPWHWLYTLPVVRQSQIGPDGHPQRGAFLPPIPQPRRMWAGSRISLHRPLCIGDAVARTSTIAAVKTRSGRSGTLVFVTVHHTWRQQGAIDAALEEWQDIVYRDPPADGEAAPPQRADITADWTHTMQPDPVLLMRYSALTFNSHRIHFDRPYATAVEGYPSLVVHGPLIATLLLDALQREKPRAQVRSFTFKAVRPLFEGRPFTLHGATTGAGALALWAADDEGHLAMQANAELA